jgi:hypothetical protein
MSCIFFHDLAASMQSQHILRLLAGLEPDTVNIHKTNHRTVLTPMESLSRALERTTYKAVCGKRGPYRKSK